MQFFRFPVSFCVQVSRAMVRKGWSTLEVPDDWLKIVRGVRPPSEKWPRAGPHQQRHQSARPAPVKKSQATIASCRRDESLEDPSFYRSASTRRHGRDGSAPASFDKSPASHGGAADRSADGCHGEIRHAGSETPPETRRDYLRSQEGVGGSGACEINRCPMRRGRRKSVAEVEDAGNRSSSPPTSSQQRAQQLQTEQDAFVKMVQEQVQESPLKRGRFLREDFVPHTDEELAQWTACQTVGDARRHCGRSHFGSVQVGGIGGRCNDIGKLGTQSFQCEQCSPLMSAPRPPRCQCGFLGVRVEASNPGPPKGQCNKRHRSRGRNVTRDPQCVVSSDDEPLVARSAACADLDATMTTVLSSTAPASSQELARVQPISGAEEDGNDEDQLRIGQQEVLESTHVRRRTRRRVLSDDDLPLTQVLLAFSHLASRRVVLDPGASGDAPRSVPDRSDSGEDGDETQFAHHGVENHRRGLVVELAPNVVDATAVELPSSPHASVVDALEFDLSVPSI